MVTQKVAAKTVPPGNIRIKKLGNNATNAPGENQDQEEMKGCSPCPPGTFQNQGREKEGKSCTAGRSQDLLEYTNFNKCQLGRVSLTGISLCGSCPSGKYEQANSCRACQAGRFNPFTQRSKCGRCPTGAFNDQTEQSSGESCKCCPQCKFVSGDGDTHCTDCGWGKYQNATGSSECKVRNAGRFNNQRGQESCRLCPIGRFNPLTQQRMCNLCPPGRFTDVTGAKTCPLCQVGRFSSGGATSQCTKCSAGEYQDTEESSGCKLCSQGEFESGLGSSQGKKCSTSECQDVKGGSECKECSQFVFEEGNLLSRYMTDGTPETELYDNCLNCQRALKCGYILYQILLFLRLDMEQWCDHVNFRLEVKGVNVTYLLYSFPGFKSGRRGTITDGLFEDSSYSPNLYDKWELSYYHTGNFVVLRFGLGTSGTVSFHLNATVTHDFSGSSRDSLQIDALTTIEGLGGAIGSVLFKLINFFVRMGRQWYQKRKDRDRCYNQRPIPTLVGEELNLVFPGNDAGDFQDVLGELDEYLNEHHGITIHSRQVRAQLAAQNRRETPDETMKRLAEIIATAFNSANDGGLFADTLVSKATCGYWKSCYMIYNEIDDEVRSQIGREVACRCSRANVAFIFEPPPNR